jgi:hypothetical protein
MDQSASADMLGVGLTLLVTTHDSVLTMLPFFNYALVVALALLCQEAGASESRVDECLVRKECKFMVWRAAHPPAKIAFAILGAEWSQFSPEDKEEVRRRLQTYLTEMRKDPARYAESREFGAGIAPSSLMFRLIVHNIERANAYTVLLCHISSDGLMLDAEVRSFGTQ